MVNMHSFIKNTTAPGETRYNTLCRSNNFTSPRNSLNEGEKQKVCHDIFYSPNGKTESPLISFLFTLTQLLTYYQMASSQLNFSLFSPYLQSSMYSFNCLMFYYMKAFVSYYDCVTFKWMLFSAFSLFNRKQANICWLWCSISLILVLLKY